MPEAPTPTPMPSGTAAEERDPAREVAARLPVTDRGSWLLLLGVGLVLLGGVLWLFLGRAPELVSGRGMVVPETGFVDVGTAVAGTVVAVLVSPGEEVEAGQPVARVVPPGAAAQEVQTPVAGRIATVLAHGGGVTELGVPLLTVDPEQAPLVVTSFVPAGSGQRVVPGMTALVAIDSAPRSQYGMITGRVTTVAALPVTRARVASLVGGDEFLAAYYLDQGPALEVTIGLDEDPSAPSGYHWTLGTGPDVDVAAGTLADVSVVVADRSPLGRITS